MICIAFAAQLSEDLASRERWRLESVACNLCQPITLVADSLVSPAHAQSNSYFSRGIAAVLQINGKPDTNAATDLAVDRVCNSLPCVCAAGRVQPDTMHDCPKQRDVSQFLYRMESGMSNVVLHWPQLELVKLPQCNTRDAFLSCVHQCFGHCNAVIGMRACCTNARMLQLLLLYVGLRG